MRKPNIVFIQSDSMDGRIMGCSGHSAAYTPNLDKLSSNGVLFKNTYCNSPQCVPSRSSMWSGKYTHKIEGWNNFKGITESTKTFMSDLSRNGYKVAEFGRQDHLSGKHGIGNRVTAWARSVDVRRSNAEGHTAIIIDEELERVHLLDWDTLDRSCEWIKSEAEFSQPFMLYVGFLLPHPKFKTSKMWLDKIDKGKITIPPVDNDIHPVMEYMRTM